MQLFKFQVTNFRSVEDSGIVEIGKIAALVGRNESGKSNILLALASLNPKGKRQKLDEVKDFPRSRRLEECKPNTHVVWTWWKLKSEQQAELAKVVGTKLEEVAVGRGYAPDLWVQIKVPRPTVDAKKVGSTLKRLKPVLEPAWTALADDGQKTNCANAWDALEKALAHTDDNTWANAVTSAAGSVRKTLGAVSIMLSEAQDELLAEFEDQATAITGYDKKMEEGRALIAKWLPRFVYVSDFPELSGYQDLDQFLSHRGQNPSLKEREDNFEKLAEVAGFDPAELNSHREEAERRGHMLNRASAVITAEIKRLWKDRPLDVHIGIDGRHVTIRVSDPNAQYPIQINLDERSRGFRWFFAFYVTFSADTKGGDADGAILLLDEPGLYLHAKSQEHLLKHLRQDYKNQIVYTTHSPFMIPPDAVEIVRTVNIEENTGTRVTQTPSGDSRTLFPLQAALGYQLSQTLFVGHSNLVVEGVTDFWILSAVNAHFLGNGTPGLPDELTITPAGGAGKVSYMAALLASEELNVLVLLDDDRAGRDTQKELVTNKLLRDTAVLFVTETMDPKPTEADIEDLLDPAVYEQLVADTYKTELKGKKLNLNTKIPRIVKRYEEAFAAFGLEFHKTRPAREFMGRMGTNHASVLPASSAARFAAIFKELTVRYGKMKDKGAFK